MTVSLSASDCFSAPLIRAQAPIYETRFTKTAGTSPATRLFLSHSHKDIDLAKGLATELLAAGLGFTVYIDSLDHSLPSSPNRETAQRIKEIIQISDFFIFLATKNSKASRWCPWEIGYADGVLDIDQIVMAPFKDDEGIHGNEYLSLYRRIDPADLQKSVGKERQAMKTATALGTISKSEYNRQILEEFIHEPIS